jgi:hypothetical protein
MRRASTREGLVATTRWIHQSVPSANEELGKDIYGFVFPMSMTFRGKNDIAVAVDKLSRQAHFLSLLPKFDAVNLANRYLHEVARHRRLPKQFISDRELRFMSLFWTNLMKSLCVKRNLSTAYHSQSDEQLERCSVVECYIALTQLRR